MVITSFQHHMNNKWTMLDIPELMLFHTVQYPGWTYYILGNKVYEYESRTCCGRRSDYPGLVIEVEEHRLFQF